MSGITPASDSQPGNTKSGAASAKNGIRTFCRSVLHSTWDEYMSWSMAHCQQTLDNLSSPVHRQPTISSTDSVPWNPTSVNFDAEIFEIADFDETSTIPKVHSTNAAHETLANDVLQAYSAYDSCTPTSRNLMLGDDPDYLPFIPFSDDPYYDFEFDNSHHKYFAWQKNDIEPDLEEIIYRTFQKLVSDHNLSYREIDKAHILPLSTSDIIKFGEKRDFSNWGAENTKPLIPVAEYIKMTPRETVQFFLDRFCNNLNCVTSFCPTHLKTRPPRPPPHKTDSSRIPDVLDKPCGLNCFMQPMSNIDTLGIMWTAEDIELLNVTLDYAPDSLPCDLAVICRKPCREVYRHQKSYKSPYAQAEKPMYINTKGLREFNMLDSQKRRFAVRLPCQHAGPCDAKSKCACYLTKAPCFSRCGCGKSCPRRWKGCSCATSAKLCGTKKCSCFRAFIECDPEVCIPCEARDATSTLCRNVGIQRGNFKATEVRQSKWGLGLFITEPCPKRDLIAEYVGELIYNPTVRSRAGISTHKGRSYIFDLNRRVSIDAAYAGNETRYINHSSDANCDTSVLLVNGEHRIGIFAARNLEANEELFIDYGPQFFGDITEEVLS